MEYTLHQLRNYTVYTFTTEAAFLKFINNLTDYSVAGKHPLWNEVMEPTGKISIHYDLYDTTTTSIDNSPWLLLSGFKKPYPSFRVVYTVKIRNDARDCIAKE